jgi:hypothetical protein
MPVKSKMHLEISGFGKMEITLGERHDSPDFQDAEAPAEKYVSLVNRTKTTSAQLSTMACLCPSVKTMPQTIW